MKTNVFLKKVCFVSLVIAQTIASAWTSYPNPETEEGPFVSVPRDVQLHTCGYLDTKDLVIAAGVSKAFQTLCSEDTLWAKRVPEAKTKKDAVTIFTTPMVKYPAKTTGAFVISCYDVLTFLKTGRFIIGDSAYACRTPTHAFTPKQKLLTFLKGSYPYLRYPKFSIQLQRDGKAILSNGDYVYPQTTLFEPQRLETNLCTFVAPEQVPSHDSISAEEFAKWKMAILSTLESYYTDALFDTFWGVIVPFDYLKPMLSRLGDGKNLPLETKEKIANFFIQKYADFKKVNDSSCGEGHYASEYLCSLKNALKKELELDIDFPS